MLQLCLSWLDIAYDASPKHEPDTLPKQEVASAQSGIAPKPRLRLPQLNVLYDDLPAIGVALDVPVRSNQTLAPPHSTKAHYAFWAHCIGENVLQLFQAAASARSDIAATLQPCRALLLQEMRSSGTSLNSMNAFAFERFASPPAELQALVALMNSTSAISAIENARSCTVSHHDAQLKPRTSSSVLCSSSKSISNTLSCRRRFASNDSDIAPVFGPLEEVASTREMIRSIALIPALGEPCVVAAGSNFLAEIKLSPKGAIAGRVAKAASKSMESVVSSGLKKFGNSLFAKVQRGLRRLRALFSHLAGLLHRLTNTRSLSV
jgi:hypothetical protein